MPWPTPRTSATCPPPVSATLPPPAPPLSPRWEMLLTAFNELVSDRIVWPVCRPTSSQLRAAVRVLCRWPRPPNHPPNDVQMLPIPSSWVSLKQAISGFLYPDPLVGNSDWPRLPPNQERLWEAAYLLGGAPPPPSAPYPVGPVLRPPPPPPNARRPWCSVPPPPRWPFN